MQVFPVVREVGGRSPIEWDNIVLYGEYVLNRRLVRRGRSRP